MRLFRHHFLRIFATLSLAMVLTITSMSMWAAPAFAADDEASEAAPEKIESGETAAAPEKITVMLTGDLMCQPLQQMRAFDGTSYDFKPTFKYVKGIFDEADIVIGNLETLVSKSLPLSKDMNRLQSKPYLNAPEEWLDALEYAGFDGFIMANNHACDGGEIGISETLEALDSRNLPHTGLFKSRQDKRYFLMEQKGIKIGVISYAAYYNLKDKFLSEEKQEYIIAYNHSGTEYSHIPAVRQERYGIMLAQADFLTYTPWGTSHPQC